jgi:hypothetical protein
MTKEEIYDAWAPERSIWSPWAKPVLFSYANRVGADAVPPATSLTTLNWTGGSDPKTVVVVDLPGSDSVHAGWLLASIGFRPVPLFNALPEPKAFTQFAMLVSDPSMVNVKPIVTSLALNAPAIALLTLPDYAPPAFLLDANRRISCQIFDDDEDAFDNRSISLPTDFPSANLLLSRGINRAVVVQASSEARLSDFLARGQLGLVPQPDLAHTLRRWQQGGIKIFMKPIDQNIEPQPVTVSRPPFFRMFFYNFMAAIGFKRNVLGGFGGWLGTGSAG